MRLPKVALIAAALLAALAGCKDPAPPTAAPAVVVTVGAQTSSSTPPVVATPPPDAGARASRCALAPGQVSDDDTPLVRGGGALTAPVDWFTTRGVSRDATLKWLSKQAKRPFVDAEIAFSQVGSVPCRTWRVGDKAEEALVCTFDSATTYSETRASIAVVRNRALVLVLDVGLGVASMGFPESHDLDLSLALGADGREVEVRDRAAEGAVLVEAPSACLERQKAAAPSAGALGGGQFGLPAKLYGCGHAVPAMQKSVKDHDPSDKTWLADTKAALTFVEKACRERGTWTWKGDRFALAH